jgi:hypothetical protein
VLLDLTGSGAIRPDGPVSRVLTAGDALASAAAPWRDRINVVAGRPVSEPPPAAAMLIRPDGYVAWAVGPDTGDLAGGLPEALRTWFGVPG